MSTVIKSYTAIIVCLLSFFIALNVVSAHLDVQNATDYHSAVVDEIENSHHASSVVDALKTEASENGYELEVENFYGANQTTLSKVTLKYKYRLNILDVENEHEVVGYAR